MSPVAGRWYAAHGRGGAVPGEGGDTGGAVVWEPTPRADGTEIGGTEDTDFIAISSNDEYTRGCPSLKKNSYWGTTGGIREIVLRIMREPDGVLHPRQIAGTGVPAFAANALRYCSGAFIATGNYGTNWPCAATDGGSGSGYASFAGPHPALKRSFGLNHRIECEVIAPAKDGAYTCLWLMTGNKDNAAPQGVIEIDWAENTPTLVSTTSPTNLRTTHFTARHLYTPSPGETTPVQGRTLNVPDITQNFIHVAAEFTGAPTPQVRFYLNGSLVRTTSGCKNTDGTTQTDAQLFFMANCHIGYPQNSFRNGYCNPFPTDCDGPGEAPASWEMRIRNLKVTAL